MQSVDIMTTEKPAVIPLLEPKSDPGDPAANGNTQSSMASRMKAVHYEGPFKVSVKEVERPKIEHPDDAIVKVTTAGTSMKNGALPQANGNKPYVDLTCTCIKAERLQKLAWSSAMRTWE
jgi:hypothetical protein